MLSRAQNGPARRKAPQAPLSAAVDVPRELAPATEPDLAAARKLLLELLSIPGGSGDEGAVADFIAARLTAAGVDAAFVKRDQANRHTILSGNTGNLIVKLPGTRKGPRRLLMAHMDTVPICVGARPVLKGGHVEAADPTTGLGGDDRAGCAVILSALLTLWQQKLPHPPLTFLWTIQEEVGLYGARHVQAALLGKPELAFNWDGSAAHKLVIGATGGYRMNIQIHGLASHAGNAPEQGVSAIGIAGLAIAELVRTGWHGSIAVGDRTGTSNIGVIHGGAATNVVTDLVELRAEARSHNPTFRKRIVAKIEQAFERAAKSIKSSSGRRGRVAFDGGLDYESFRLPVTLPAVTVAKAAAAQVAGKADLAISNGGLDANWMAAHGIPTVTLGCGQEGIHTVNERVNLEEFDKACRIALRLAMGS